MTFTDQVKVDARGLVNPAEFGEQITYDPRGAAPARLINALVDPAVDVETGQVLNSTQLVLILADETTIDPGTGQPIGIASPKAGDILTIRGRTCRVQRHTPGGDGSHELEVEVGS